MSSCGETIVILLHLSARNDCRAHSQVMPVTLAAISSRWLAACAMYRSTFPLRYAAPCSLLVYILLQPLTVVVTGT